MGGTFTVKDNTLIWLASPLIKIKKRILFGWIWLDLIWFHYVYFLCKFCKVGYRMEDVVEMLDEDVEEMLAYIPCDRL
jgi:hypothetical protein